MYLPSLNNFIISSNCKIFLSSDFDSTTIHCIGVIEPLANSSDFWSTQLMNVRHCMYECGEELESQAILPKCCRRLWSKWQLCQLCRFQRGRNQRMLLHSQNFIQIAREDITLPRHCPCYFVLNESKICVVSIKRSMSILVSHNIEQRGKEERKYMRSTGYTRLCCLRKSDLAWRRAIVSRRGDDGRVLSFYFLGGSLFVWMT